MVVGRVPSSRPDPYYYQSIPIAASRALSDWQSEMAARVFDQGRDHSRRELPGYGADPPNAQWPNGAKVCLSFVVNYEEGGEHVAGGQDGGSAAATLNDDEHAEAFLTESGVGATVPGATRAGARNLGTESGYEFGSHRGFHRILSLFRSAHLRFTSWAIGRAVELNPQVVPLMEEAGCEVASHSWRWIDYSTVPEHEEREHVCKAIAALTKASPLGKAPAGWYTGRQSLQTRRIVYEEYRDRGMLDRLYDSDSCTCGCGGGRACGRPNSHGDRTLTLLVPFFFWTEPGHRR